MEILEAIVVLGAGVVFLILGGVALISVLVGLLLERATQRAKIEELRRRIKRRDQTIRELRRGS